MGVEHTLIWRGLTAIKKLMENTQDYASSQLVITQARQPSGLGELAFANPALIGSEIALVAINLEIIDQGISFPFSPEQIADLCLGVINQITPEE